MSVTSNRQIVLNNTGDVEFQQSFNAAVNPLGSGQNQLVNLSSGANTITVPTSATAVTIIPPASNAVTMIWKGVTGDTGVGMHLTDPTSFALASTVTTLVITAGGAITGLRLIYS